MRNVSLLVLYNDKKEILMQHRSKDATRLPNYWGFFGGGIESEETPEQALSREIIEELNYKVGKSDLYFTQDFVWQGDKSTKHVFIEKYNEIQPLTQHEGQDMAWLSLKDTKDLLIVDHDRITLQKIFDFLNSLK